MCTAIIILLYNLLLAHAHAHSHTEPTSKPLITHYSGSIYHWHATFQALSRDTIVDMPAVGGHARSTGRRSETARADDHGDQKNGNDCRRMSCVVYLIINVVDGNGLLTQIRAVPAC